MYLTRAFYKNMGAIESVALDLRKDGGFKSVVFVGSNGSGKTSVLSSVADSIFELAGAYYTDAIAGQTGTQRPWFRIVGGATVRAGTTGSAVILEFSHDGKKLIYREKAGTVEPSSLNGFIPEDLIPNVQWQPAGNVKDLVIQPELAKSIIESGAYVFFPSSRSELPYWINKETIKPDFSFDLKFDTRLNKSIFVEKGFKSLQPWLLDLILEARLDRISLEVTEKLKIAQLSGDVLNNIPDHKTLSDLIRSDLARQRLYEANSILQKTLTNTQSSFVWAGRKAYSKLTIETQGGALLPSIDCISAGQSTLLAIFLTLLRYGDISEKAVDAANLQGICMIDEIDAHMHTDLQFEVIPSLIEMFPKVQFIISTHSPPLVALGIESRLGNEKAIIVDMPSGETITAERFSEFQRAMDVMRQTALFQSAISDAIIQSEKNLVLVEGETDPIYLRKARSIAENDEEFSDVEREIIAGLEFEWIGAKQGPAGRNTFSGKDSLNQALSFLRANSSFAKGKYSFCMIAIQKSLSQTRDDCMFGRLI